VFGSPVCLPLSASRVVQAKGSVGSYVLPGHSRSLGGLMSSLICGERLLIGNLSPRPHLPDTIKMKYIADNKHGDIIITT